MNAIEKVAIFTAALLMLVLTLLSILMVDVHAGPIDAPAALPWYCHIWPAASGCWPAVTAQAATCNGDTCWITRPAGRAITVTSPVAIVIDRLVTSLGRPVTCRFFGPVANGFTAVKDCR